MGHCCSCYELRATDTNIAAEILANADEYGAIVPTNIAPGLFLQLATDNTDVNEETLDGKKTHLMRHLWLPYDRMDQNHHQSNWPTTMTRNYPYKQVEGFTS